MSDTFSDQLLSVIDTRDTLLLGEVEVFLAIVFRVACQRKFVPEVFEGFVKGSPNFATVLDSIRF